MLNFYTLIFSLWHCHSMEEGESCSKVAWEIINRNRSIRHDEEMDQYLASPFPDQELVQAWQHGLCG